jgi:hypothetical protein
MSQITLFHGKKIHLKLIWIVGSNSLETHQFLIYQKKNTKKIIIIFQHFYLILDNQNKLKMGKLSHVILNEQQSCEIIIFTQTFLSLFYFK